MADDITSKFKIDISDLKKNLADANKQIKLANATFKAETAGMTNWSKSADGVSSRIKALSTTLDAQRSKLDSYKQQLERQQSAYDENGKRAEELKKKLAELTAQGVDPASKEFKAYQSELSAVEKAQEQGQNAIDGLKVSILNQEAAVKSTEKEINTYSGTLEELKTAEEEAAKEAERSQSAYGQLKSMIEQQETTLTGLKDEYAQVVVAEGENSAAAQELAAQISSLSGALSDNKAKLDSADGAADKFDNTLGDVKDNAENAGDGFSVMKGALADLVSTAIQAAVSALKDMASAAYEAWEAYDSGADIIKSFTGASGEAADELIDVYKDVARSVKGSFDDIGTAVGEVNTRFGATGDELNELSTQFLKFAELNGTDVKSSIDSVQSAMAAFGLGTEDTAAFLDTLNKAGQDTGVAISTLTSALKTNAPALLEMGYSASDSAMLIAQLDKNGVDVSATLSGMKKALTNAAKEGKPLTEAMSDMEEAIRGAKDSTEAITIASELFGNKAGAAIAVAVRDGRLSFEAMGTSVNDFAGNLDSTYDSILSANDMLDLAVQNVKLDVAEMVDEFLQVNSGAISEAFEGLTSTVLPAFKALISGADGAEAAVGEAVGGIVTKIVTKFTEGLPQIMKVGTTIIGSLIKGLAAALPDVVKTVAQTLREVLGTLGELLPEIVSTIIDIVPDIVNALSGAAPELFEGAVAFFKAIIEAIPELMKQLSTAIPEMIRSISDFLIDGIPILIDGAITLFEALVEAIPAVIPIYGEYIPDLVEAIAQMLVDNTPVLLEGAVKLFGAIVKAIPKITADLARALADVVNVIITKLSEPVMNVFSDLKGTLSETWGGIAVWVYDNMIQPIKDAVSEMWDGLLTGATAAWDSVKKVFATVAEFFGTIFGDAWSKVKDIFNTGGRIFEGIKEGITAAFKAIVNALIEGINNVVSVPFDTINGLLNKIRATDVLGIKPFESLWGENPLKVPQIPLLARGGILSRGQIGLLEGTGAEAVVPLENNKAWIKAVADQMYTQVKMSGVLRNAEVNALGDTVADMTAVINGMESLEQRMTEMSGTVSALAAVMEKASAGTLSEISGIRSDVAAQSNAIVGEIDTIRTGGVPIANRAAFMQSVSDGIDDILGAKAARRSRGN